MCRRAGSSRRWRRHDSPARARVRRVRRSASWPTPAQRGPCAAGGGTRRTYRCCAGRLPRARGGGGRGPRFRGRIGARRGRFGSRRSAARRQRRHGRVVLSKRGRAPALATRIAFVGGPEAGQRLHEDLARAAGDAYVLAGRIGVRRDDDAVPVIGGLGSLRATVVRERIDLVVLGGAVARLPPFDELTATCLDLPLRIAEVSDLRGCLRSCAGWGDQCGLVRASCRRPRAPPVAGGQACAGRGARGTWSSSASDH